MRKFVYIILNIRIIIEQSTKKIFLILNFTYKTKIQQFFVISSGVRREFARWIMMRVQNICRHRLIHIRTVDMCLF